MRIASSMFHQIVGEGILTIADLKWNRKPVSRLLVDLFQYSMSPQQAGRVTKHFEHLVKFG